MYLHTQSIIPTMHCNTQTVFSHALDLIYALHTECGNQGGVWFSYLGDEVQPGDTWHQRRIWRDNRTKHEPLQEAWREVTEHGKCRQSVVECSLWMMRAGISFKAVCNKSCVCGVGRTERNLQVKTPSSSLALLDCVCGA